MYTGLRATIQFASWLINALVPAEIVELVDLCIKLCLLLLNHQKFRQFGIHPFSGVIVGEGAATVE